MGWLSDQPDLTVKERPEIGLYSAVTTNCSSAARRRLRTFPPSLRKGEVRPWAGRSGPLISPFSIAALNSAVS